MMLTDPIADLLTRIRNASMARKDSVTVPYSKMKMAVLKVLQNKGFVQEFNNVKNNDFQEINIVLNPERQEISLKKISKPGQRIYVKTSQIKKINGGLGVAVVSTPKGIMSGEEAKKQNLGGELICEIY
ncbi:MAG: 30S ribosomal protein S8 [Candidatus Gracilibacteria bacterium]